MRLCLLWCSLCPAQESPLWVHMGSWTCHVQPPSRLPPAGLSVPSSCMEGLLFLLRSMFLTHTPPALFSQQNLNLCFNLCFQHELPEPI